MTLIRQYGSRAAALRGRDPVEEAAVRAVRRRIWVDRRGRIVGGTLVGPRAGECLAELTLAVTRGLRTRDLAGSTHAYPTYVDGLWNAAIADVLGQAGRAAAVPGRPGRARPPPTPVRRRAPIGRHPNS